MCHFLLRRPWLAAMSFLLTLACAPADATMQFFYDPTTGNVSLDSTNTRSGTALTYSLYLPSHRRGSSTPVPADVKDVRFRNENLVRISNTTFLFNEPDQISDQSIGSPLSGLYTLGDILPAGLSQHTWERLFATHNTHGGTHDPLIASQAYGTHGYVDLIGGGSPPPAEFIYGAPDRPFENRWDLVDPDTLAWASQADLIYNPFTGELSLDTTGPDGGHISSLWLKAPFPIFDAAQALEIEGVNKFPSLQNDLVYRADALEPGVYSLGRVLDIAISASDLEGLFEQRSFIARAGFDSVNLDFAMHGISMNVVYLPEPALVALPSLLLEPTHFIPSV